MEKSKYNGGRKMEMININNKGKIDGLWDCVGDEAAAVGGGVFPWPPRSYTCSFCKRYFRSAQALGGHMNIHRRDRARLRQSPPPTTTTRDTTANGNEYAFLNLNHEPNPNLNFNPKFIPPFTSRLMPPLFSSQLPSNNYPSNLSVSVSESRGGWGNAKPTSFGNIGATKRLLLDHQHFGNMTTTTTTALSLKDGKRADFVRLDLEIGMLREENQDLDLELRLGYT